MTKYTSIIQNQVTCQEIMRTAKPQLDNNNVNIYMTKSYLHNTKSSNLIGHYAYC